MRKLNNTQKKMIDNFIKNNRSAGIFLSCSVIDSSGEIENINNYESVCSDIERYYSDNAKPQKLTTWSL